MKVQGQDHLAEFELTPLTPAQAETISFRFARDRTELRSVEELQAEGVEVMPLADHLAEFTTASREEIEEAAGTVIVISDEGREWFSVDQWGHVVDPTGSVGA